MRRKVPKGTMKSLSVERRMPKVEPGTVMDVGPNVYHTKGARVRVSRDPKICTICKKPILINQLYISYLLWHDRDRDKPLPFPLHFCTLHCTDVFITHMVYWVNEVKKTKKYKDYELVIAL